jgi:N-acetylglucosamine kinase-like BadF-type ATPase
MFVLGIDAGGTKTVCQLADERAGLRIETRGPGATLQASGELAVEQVLREVIEPALRDPEVRPTAVCLGMAGVDRPLEADIVRGILSRLVPSAERLVVNDALVALEAGVGAGPGVVVLAGTGSIAYGRDQAGHAARAGGWGYVLGDEGSGYWLGRRALRAVVRAADRRGLPTSLTQRILDRYQVEREQDLVHQVYYGGSKPTTIAALSGIVQAAAADDQDEVAHRILNDGATELATAALAVARRLGLEACPFLLGGGVFPAVPLLASGVAVRVRAVLPRATVDVLAVEPACGAVRLAIALAEGRASIPQYVDDDAP